MSLHDFRMLFSLHIILDPPKFLLSQGLLRDLLSLEILKKINLLVVIEQVFFAFRVSLIGLRHAENQQKHFVSMTFCKFSFSFYVHLRNFFPSGNLFHISQRKGLLCSKGLLFIASLQDVIYITKIFKRYSVSPMSPEGHLYQ